MMRLGGLAWCFSRATTAVFAATIPATRTYERGGFLVPHESSSRLMPKRQPGGQRRRQQGRISSLGWPVDESDDVHRKTSRWLFRRQAAMDAIEKELGVHEFILSSLSPFPLPGTCLQTMVQRLESIDSSEETLGDGGLLVPSLCFMSDPCANSSQIAKGPR